MHELKHSYSDGITYTRIALCGIYPPPFGGVSVHVQRVMNKLQTQQNHVRFFNTEVSWRYKLFFLYVCKLVLWLLWHRPGIVMYHSIYLSNSMFEMRLLVWLKHILHYELLFIEHDCRHLYKRSIKFKNYYNHILEQVNHLILIGSRTHISYQENHIHLPLHTIESAFLPPDIHKEIEIIQHYPISLFAFLKKRRPVIVMNACQLILLEGKDLYGIDLTIHAIEQLRMKYPSIGLIVVLGHIGDQQYFKNLQTLINEKNMHDNIYILSGQKELWPLFKRVTLFVRPTLSDGASVSVEEAHFCGIPVVASDVCWRPHNTVLFKTGDQEDLIIKLDEVLRKTHAVDLQRDRMHAQSS